MADENEDQLPEHDGDADTTLDENSIDGEINGEQPDHGEEEILASGMIHDAESADPLENAEDDTDTDDESEEDDDDAEEEDAGPESPLESVVEAVLFASREPLKLKQLARAAGRRVRQDAVREAIDRLNLHYLETGRAFEIAEISQRYQLMSRPEYVSYIAKVQPKREPGEKEKSNKLTPAALDTLSIVAYKQAVTRAEIERIRGVGCGPALKALIERGSVRVAGKRTDLIGQPLTYGTTEAFLVEFGLGSLDELPLRNEFLSSFPEEQIAPEATVTEDAAQAEDDPEEDSGDSDELDEQANEVVVDTDEEDSEDEEELVLSMVHEEAADDIDGLSEDEESEEDFDEPDESDEDDEDFEDEEELVLNMVHEAAADEIDELPHEENEDGEDE